MTFYKILDFKYQGRCFTAFRNKLGYQTFLEYQNDGNKRKYHYIDQVTYMKLYDMFVKKKPSFYDDGDKKRRGYRFIPKMISLAGALIILSGCGVNNDKDANLWPSDIFDKNEVIVTDDYEVYEIVKAVNLLTTDGLELYWNEDNVTFDEVREALASNKNIDDYLADYINDFIDHLEMNMPNVNLACFINNVRNLRSESVGDLGMLRSCGSSTATACFLADTTTIYYNKDRLNDENFEYIMYHEIGHMLLNGYKEVRGYTTFRHYTTATNTGFMVEEGLDTILIEDVIGVSLKDVSYRLPANYDRILMAATNYTLADYVNGNHLDFEKRIKEYLGEDYNVDNLPFLFEYQKYNIRDNKDVEMEDSEFHDLYEVVAGAFFKSHAELMTSKEEIVHLYDELIEEITRDVYSKNESYTFDFTGLKDGLRRVLESENISHDLWPEEAMLTTFFTVNPPKDDYHLNK